jgi:hypothetical protein
MPKRKKQPQIAASGIRTKTAHSLLKAIATAQQALARANATGKQELVQQIESWLKNYSVGFPNSVNDAPSTIPSQSQR